MFSGAQISLYPMTGDFVAVITTALAALDPHRAHARIARESPAPPDPPRAIPSPFPLAASSLHRRHPSPSPERSRGAAP